MSRILAVDYGKKRVGLALSDPTRTLASGLPTLVRRPKQPLPEAIRRLVEEHDVSHVLVGLPLGPDGASGQAAREVERFAAALRERLSVPVTLVDERYSTVRAYELLRERGTRAKAAKGQVDRVSAALLLQDWLDARKEEPEAP
jgi:putative Holliday junction resolvase